MATVSSAKPNNRGARMTVQEQVEAREVKVSAITEGLRLRADKERIIREGSITFTGGNIQIGGLAAEFADILEGKKPGKQDKRPRCARCKAIMQRTEDDSLECPKGCLPLSCWSCGSEDIGPKQRCNRCGETQSLLRGVKPIWEDQPLNGMAEYAPECTREECHTEARATLAIARNRKAEGMPWQGLRDYAIRQHGKHIPLTPLTAEDSEEAARLYEMLRRHTSNQIADGKRVGQKIRVNGGKVEAVVSEAGVQASGLKALSETSGKLAKKERVHYSKHESKLHLSNDAWKEELPTFGLLSILDRSQKTDSPLGKVVTQSGQEVNQSIKTEKGDSRLLVDWFREESIQSGGPSKGANQRVQCPSGMDIDTFLEYMDGKSEGLRNRDHRNIEQLPAPIDFNRVLREVKHIMPKQFAAWKASKVNGMTQEEVAARQGVTQGCIAKRIAQADSAIKQGVSALIAAEREATEVRVIPPSLPPTVSKVPGITAARQGKAKTSLAEQQAQAGLAEQQRQARQAIASKQADKSRFRMWEAVQEVKIKA